MSSTGMGSTSVSAVKRMPPSEIPMTTNGCFRRSKRAFPAESGRTEMDVGSLAELKGTT